MNIVTQSAELEGVINEIRTSGRFAMDLEFIPEKTFRPELCLVQIGTPNQVYIIDPLVLKDLSALWQCVADPNIEKVLHAATQDLDLIYNLSHSLPQNIFDTQIAAGFAGFGFPVGYSKLLYQLLSVSIPKSESFTDWLERPLKDAQLSYAVEDVCHLLDMADKLKGILEGLGRLTWVKEECEHYTEIEQYEQSEKYAFTKIKGSQSLNRRSLAILQALCSLRHEEATRTNRPLRSILSDTTLLELSRRPPKTLEDMQGYRSVRPDKVRVIGKQILSAVENALSLNMEECPSWPNGRVIPKSELLAGDMLFAILKVLSYKENIATELVATRDDIQSFVRLVKEQKVNNSKLSLLNGWRADIAGNALAKLVEEGGLKISFAFSEDPPILLS